VTDRSSFMTGAATGGGGTAISSTSTAMTSPSPTCIDSGSTYGGWEWGSKGAACALSNTGFRGARLRMSVSTRLQKRQDKVEERASRKTRDNGTKDENLHLGTDPGSLHRIVRRACSRAARLVLTDSGATSLLPAASAVALRSPGCSGLSFQPLSR
jgi:hypothetical protein